MVVLDIVLIIFGVAFIVLGLAGAAREVFRRAREPADRRLPIDPERRREAAAGDRARQGRAAMVPSRSVRPSDSVAAFAVRRLMPRRALQSLSLATWLSTRSSAAP